MRTVNIVASYNDHRELERLLVRVNQHLRCCLGCGVRVCWGKNAGFQQIVGIVPDLSVDLISGDVDELLDSNLLGRLQDNVCTINVGVGECVGVAETQVNVGLSSEMEDGVNVVSLQTVHDLGGVCDITMVEGEVSFVVKGSSVVQGGAVVEFVEGYDVVGIGVGQGQMSYQPASTAEGLAIPAHRDWARAESKVDLPRCWRTGIEERWPG